MKLRQIGTVSFSIKLAFFLARGGAHMKLRLTGTVKRLNVEHRTSNIEHRILMTLRFIDFKTSESQNQPEADKFRRVDPLAPRVAQSFFK
jgi:hypothetical protein